MSNLDFSLEHSFYSNLGYSISGMRSDIGFEKLLSQAPKGRIQILYIKKASKKKTRKLKNWNNDKNKKSEKLFLCQNN